MVCPFIVHGDELAEKTEEKPSGLISGTVETLSGTVKNVTGQAGQSTGSILEETTKSVGKTVKDTVDFTAGTVEKLSDPVGNKVITSTVKDTGSLVEKAVGNTTPVVKTTVKETTGTVTKTTSEVFDAVDKTVDNLPAVPVVTPIVKEVNKTVQKVTSGVQQTVEKTTDAVNETVEVITDTTEKTVDVVGGAADLPYQEENTTPVQPESPVTEKPAKEEVTRPAVPVTQPQAPSDNEFPVNEVPADIQPPVENGTPAIDETGTEKTPLQEAPPALIGKEVIEVPATQPIAEENNDVKQPAAAGPMEINEAPVASMTQLPVAENEMDRNEVAKETTPVAQTPIFPTEQDGSRAVATVPVQSGSPSAQASGSFAGHSADLGYGTISSSEMFKVSTEKLWYHKNSYAIIQWIHTPLRKPPAATPFLYVA